jgi:hypothetical protein
MNAEADRLRTGRWTGDSERRAFHFAGSISQQAVEIHIEWSRNGGCRGFDDGDVLTAGCWLLAELNSARLCLPKRRTAK